MDVRTADNRARAKICTDGSVLGAQGTVIGYLNQDGSAGDKEETLLGTIKPSGLVYTAFSQVVGKIDSNGGKAQDMDGRPLLHVLPSGEIHDAGGRKVGSFSPYKPKFLNVALGYFFFLDPAIALPDHFSLVTQAKGKGFDTAGTTQNILTIYDKNNKVRGAVTTDGEVFDGHEKLLGYLNQDGSCGDVQEVFLGEITKTGQVVNGFGNVIGAWRSEGMIIQYGQEVAGSIQSSGELHNASHKLVGTVKDLDSRKILLLAGFLFFFDTTLLTTPVVEEKPRAEEKRGASSSAKVVDETEELARMEREFEEERKRIEAELEDMEEKPAEVHVPTPSYAKSSVPASAINTSSGNSASAGASASAAAGSRGTGGRTAAASNASRAAAASASTAATSTNNTAASASSAAGAGGAGAAGGSGWVFTKPKPADEETEGEVWVALYDYDHTDPNAKEFLSFKEGDTFQIIPSANDLQGWKIAVNQAGQKGFVPGNYLELQDSDV